MFNIFLFLDFLIDPMVIQVINSHLLFIYFIYSFIQFAHLLFDRPHSVIQVRVWWCGTWSSVAWPSLPCTSRKMGLQAGVHHIQLIFVFCVRGSQGWSEPYSQATPSPSAKNCNTGMKYSSHSMYCKISKVYLESLNFLFHCVKILDMISAFWQFVENLLVAQHRSILENHVTECVEAGWKYTCKCCLQEFCIFCWFSVWMIQSGTLEVSNSYCIEVCLL